VSQSEASATSCPRQAPLHSVFSSCSAVVFLPFCVFISCVPLSQYKAFYVLHSKCSITTAQLQFTVSLNTRKLVHFGIVRCLVFVNRSVCKVEIARQNLGSGTASFLVCRRKGAICCRTECCHSQNPVECIAVSVTSLPNSRNCNVFTPRTLR
jgi:hypothetical protein